MQNSTVPGRVAAEMNHQTNMMKTAEQMHAHLTLKSLAVISVDDSERALDKKHTCRSL